MTLLSSVPPCVGWVADNGRASHCHALRRQIEGALQGAGRAGDQPALRLKFIGRRCRQHQALHHAAVLQMAADDLVQVALVHKGVPDGLG